MSNDYKVSELNNFYYALAHGIFKLKKAKHCDMKVPDNTCMKCNARNVCKAFNSLMVGIEKELDNREILSVLKELNDREVKEI